MHILWQFSIFLLFVAQSLISNEDTAIDTFCGEKNFDNYRKHLENTTWIVPPQTLLAYEYVKGENVSVSDQTVWIIDGFDGGYFFGNTYTSINQVPSSQKHLVGSITPLGDVYITFYSISGQSAKTDVVEGIGKFQKKDGRYFFVMQMNSAQNNNFGLSHWSYMISAKPDDFFYWHLPGENKSIPEFISQF